MENGNRIEKVREVVKEVNYMNWMTQQFEIRHMSPHCYFDLHFFWLLLLSFVFHLLQFYSNLSRKYASLTFSQIFTETDERALKE